MVLVDGSPRKSPVSKRTLDGRYVVGPDNDQQSRGHRSLERLIDYHTPLSAIGTKRKSDFRSRNRAQ